MIKQPNIITLGQVFATNNLVIPDYQRPYKWTESNIYQLIEDIISQKESNTEEYRLGTIVLHNEVVDKEKEEEREVLNIVDGQQRLITLSLIALAIKETFGAKKFYKRFSSINSPLLYQTFSHPITHKNIQDNYGLIKREVSKFDEELISFFFYNCKVVWVILDDISEAFQFFDSQNARGKDLDPHDLLKAFHLREMASNTEEERRNCVAHWEQMNQKELVILFNDYLYRVRNWSKGKSARYFKKSDVNAFKGISLDNPDQYNFIKPYLINHFYTEKYNKDIDRMIDGQVTKFPFQVDQVMINGKRFFEYVQHYTEMVEDTCKNYSRSKGELNNRIGKELSKNSRALRILDIIAHYEGKYRVGDKYVRNVFDCCLLYYIDKFGTDKIDQVIEKIFIWAYNLRLEKQSVKLASMDNYAKRGDSLFKTIREAIETKKVVQKTLSVASSNHSSKTFEIVNIFKELNYIQS